jgi:RNA polymerase sigma-70 factor (ECF subfamily)
MNEEELIEKAKSGDLEAFRQLVAVYYPVVERFAYQIGSPSNDIDDITQEVFLRVYRFLDTYTNAKFSTWLYKITLNISRDIIRKNKKSYEKEKKLSFEREQTFPQVEGNVLQKEDHRRLHDIILELNEKYRIPLILFYFHEKKYEEIAKILSIPLSTVKTRISRARQKVKEALAAVEGGECYAKRTETR